MKIVVTISKHKEALAAALYSTLNFVLTGCVVWLLHNMSLGKVGLGRFFIFWFIVDLFYSASRGITEKLSSHFKNSSDTSVNLTYSVVVAAFLLTILILMRLLV